MRILNGFILTFSMFASAAVSGASGLEIKNGWYVYNGRVIWGYAQHNGWWRPGQRPNLARNAPGEVRPNRTEDLEKLTDAMIKFGYPGFEHNFGLWFDRRRDAHDTARRPDDKAVPPFLEQPWARSGKGRAWDGLSKYDLEKFNPWYFERLKRFAALCDAKGLVFFHNDYMQHALLETPAHYVDFPWRPVNCIQDTGMPDSVPAANAFYDISNPVRRKLHRLYIRKCLDELGAYRSVVFLVSHEYTGPLSFVRFWLDVIMEWEKEHHRRVHIGLGACKDVLDAILTDPVRGRRISTIDLRYWWYLPDGSLMAPPGGKEIPARYALAFWGVNAEAVRRMVAPYLDRGLQNLGGSSPPQIHRQIVEYRLKYPDRAIIQWIPPDFVGSWAAFTGGCSMLIGQMPYPGLKDPPEYISPERCKEIFPTYKFIREHLARALVDMKPADSLLSDSRDTWCLADPGRNYLVFASRGGSFRIDLSKGAGKFEAKWFDPRTGRLWDAAGGTVAGGRPVEFSCPEKKPLALWLKSTGPPGDGAASAAAPLIPAEIYDRLVKELNSARFRYFRAFRAAKSAEEKKKAFEKWRGKPEEFAGKFLRLAIRFPDDDAALASLLKCMTLGRGTKSAPKALKILNDKYASSPEAAKICLSLFRDRSPEAIAFLEKVIRENRNREALAAATFVLGNIYCEKGGEKLKRGEELLEKAVKQYGDVKLGRTTIGKYAQGRLFEIRFLSVGKPAPEIEGEDVYGKKFKLSDYRGKVVVLDFWGDW